VLEDAGFRVEVPEKDLCCGRPLYDYGMLNTAQKWLRQILNVLQPQIESGMPVVALEPSCGSVFRDELKGLFPHDQNAKRLSKQTFLLSEFLCKYAPEYPRKQLERKAIVHAHCHHKAIMGVDAEQELLKKLGLDFELLQSGCCGMAGAFGFEKGEHYDVSVKCGERVLLPAAREASEETLIITNGFSCHEQISQQANRSALHLAEVLQMAIREGTIKPQPQEMEVPEHRGDGHHRLLATRGARYALAGAGAALASAGAYLWKHRKK